MILMKKANERKEPFCLVIYTQGNCSPQQRQAAKLKKKKVGFFCLYSAQKHYTL